MTDNPYARDYSLEDLGMSARERSEFEARGRIEGIFVKWNMPTQDQHDLTEEVMAVFKNYADEIRAALPARSALAGFAKRIRALERERLIMQIELMSRPPANDSPRSKDIAEGFNQALNDLLLLLREQS